MSGGRYMSTIPAGYTLMARILTGSRLYGYHTDTSDYDYIEVWKDPIDSLIGFNPIMKTKQNITDGIDVTCYGLRHFISLALDGNPNILDILFSHIWYYNTDEWLQIYEHRQFFISQQAIAKFRGYAISAEHQYKKKGDIKDYIASYRMRANLCHLSSTGKHNPQLLPSIANYLRAIKLGNITLTDLLLTDLPSYFDIPNNPETNTINDLVKSFYI